MAWVCLGNRALTKFSCIRLVRAEDHDNLLFSLLTLLQWATLTKEQPEAATEYVTKHVALETGLWEQRNLPHDHCSEQKYD
jgi:hypothetical protein